jgi:hypothetical protein
MDRGGAWAWDLWALSLCAVALLLATLVGRSDIFEADDTTVSGRLVWLVRTFRWLPVWLPVAVILLAVTQISSLPLAVQRVLSPGSVSAYTEWFQSATGISPAERFPISLAPHLTERAIAKLAVVTCFAFAACVIFRNRHFAVVMLVGLTVGGIVHSILGFIQQSTQPGIYLFGTERLGGPFGTFVNRNNAGALLNMALSGAVGLMAVRMVEASRLLRPQGDVRRRRSRRRTSHQGRSSMSQSSLPQKTNWQWEELQNLISWLLGDRLFLLALAAAMLLVAAVLSSGSRGALIGAFAGSIACLMVAIPAARLQRFAFGAIAIIGVVLVSLNALGVETQSLDRLAESQRNGDLERDGRFGIWGDAFRSSWNHIPIGAGLGAFRYAYLRDQQTGPESWALNADGQWVEWWLEGGIALQVLLAIGLLGGLTGIYVLLKSRDSIDRGLGTAGVFAFTGVGVAQSFDFGLTLPPNALLATLLVSAIVARASRLLAPYLIIWFGSSRQRVCNSSGDQDMAGMEQSSQRSAKRPKLVLLKDMETGSQRWWNTDELRRTVLGLLILGIGIWSVNWTSRLARSEALVLEAEHAFEQQRVSEESLADLAGRLQEQVDLDPGNDRLLLELASVRQQQFRLSYALDLVEKQGIALQRAYNASNAQRLRLDYISGFGEPRHLELAYEATLQALRRAPLSDVALWNLVRMDFLSSDRTLTPVVLDRLLTLRWRTPESLNEITTTAASSGHWDVARRGWRQLLQLAPRYTQRVLEQVRGSDGKVTISEVLPENREVLVAALENELRLHGKNLDREILKRCESILALPISERERQLKKQLDQTMGLKD